MRLKWYQRLLCKFLAPNFEKERPKIQEPGQWAAVSLKVTALGRMEHEIILVEGLQEAYEVSRWLALNLDRKLHSSFGVDWAVRKPKETDYGAGR